MTTRRKTSSRLTMAALSLAAALALQTGPARAQHVDDVRPAEDEIDDRPNSHPSCDVIWCWPLRWLVPCWTR